MKKNTDIKDNPALPILLIDDEVQTLRSYEIELRVAGYNNFISCISAEDGLKTLAEQGAAIIILDLALPGMDGMEMLKTLAKDFPGIPVVVVTAYNEIETAVECMKNGALDFLVKPVEKQHLMNAIDHARELKTLRRETAVEHQTTRARHLKNPENFAKIITSDPKMRSVFLYIQSVAVTSQPVLITGETGVGKELIAEAVHRASKRKGKLITLNVAGLDDTTFSDTLFGHKSGAYTDARQQRSGLIETAKDGTIFLDEIGDLKESSWQIKILRLIQEKEYYPLGGDNLIKTNARVITATNHDLRKLIASGDFRQDLYYRLKLHHIHVPPLRERQEDIKLLADKFIVDACSELEMAKPQISPEFYELLKEYSFPGNVRELQAIIYESLTLSTGGKISTDYIESLLRFEPGTKYLQTASANALHHDIPMTTLEETEAMLINKAMETHKGNLSQVAKSLGISRSTLYRKLNN